MGWVCEKSTVVLMSFDSFKWDDKIKPTSLLAVSLQSSGSHFGQYMFRTQVPGTTRGGLSVAESWRLYRARIRLTDPEKYLHNKRKNALRMRRKREEMKRRREQMNTNVVL